MHDFTFWSVVKYEIARGMARAEPGRIRRRSQTAATTALADDETATGPGIGGAPFLSLILAKGDLQNHGEPQEGIAMAQSHDEPTLRFYTESAATYVASGPGGASRHLGAFLQALEPRSKVLDLGCGGGRDSLAMIAAGHIVDPTDGSPSIARKAEELLSVPVRVMRFEDLDVLEAYDAVWANASLLHVPRPVLPAILSKVRAALRPGGLHHATYKAGGKEGRDRHGRYFNYLSQDEVIEMYERSGEWQVIAVSEYVGGGYDQAVEGPWVAIMVRRRDG